MQSTHLLQFSLTWHPEQDPQRDRFIFTGRDCDADVPGAAAAFEVAAAASEAAAAALDFDAAETLFAGGDVENT